LCPGKVVDVVVNVEGLGVEEVLVEEEVLARVGVEGEVGLLAAAQVARERVVRVIRD
jgi:hypothetical protein